MEGAFQSCVPVFDNIMFSFKRIQSKMLQFRSLPNFEISDAKSTPELPGQIDHFKITKLVEILILPGTELYF